MLDVPLLAHKAGQGLSVSHKENTMNPADTCPSDLLDLMTAARREHDRAIGDFIHRIWQALAEALTPSPASGPAHRPIQARPLPPGP